MKRTRERENRCRWLFFCVFLYILQYISESVYFILYTFYCHLDIHYILCGSSLCAAQLFSYSINRNRRIHLFKRKRRRQKENFTMKWNGIEDEGAKDENRKQSKWRAKIKQVENKKMKKKNHIMIMMWRAALKHDTDEQQHWHANLWSWNFIMVSLTWILLLYALLILAVGCQN